MIKDFAKKAVLSSGVLRLAGSVRGAGAAIIMYHSVMEQPTWEQELLGGIVHHKDVFRRQIEIVARHYRPVSLEELNARAQNGAELPGRCAVITFDDGYADNCEIAAPILNEMGIPATFFITVDCVAHQKVPWPARLRFPFFKSKKETWMDGSGRVWPLHNTAQREQAFLQASEECCVFTGAAQEKYIAQIEHILDSRSPQEAGALMMNYDQVRTLAKQGHTIGSHTMTHPNLAKVSLSDLRIELGDSKRALERELDSVVKHFSYPCPTQPPSWSQGSEEESRKAGYETAVTTAAGIARCGDNPLCWKRIMPTKTADGLNWNLQRAFAAPVTGNGRP